MSAFGALGFLAATGVTRLTPTSSVRGDRRGAVRWLVPWLWIVAMIFLFMLAYGSANLDALGVGVMISRFAWVGAMFFAGITIRQAWGKPLFGALLVFGAAQTLYAEGVFTRGVSDINALIPRLLGLAIWLLIGIFAARQGAGLRDRFSERQARLGVIGAIIAWAALFVLPLILLSGAGSNLMPLVDTRRWGGFLLTMMLTVISIVASFPLGVGLALGRRSRLPVIRWICTVYIELVRGVPLITVLFMAQLLVPLVNASLSNVDNVIRAMVGLTLFSGAYLAENVRGGLQSIPPGQEEAAKALGLAGWQVTFFIMLPQALRAVIPALVGQCIALFKDTSLVALVGLTDLTGIARAAIAQTEYIGLQAEVFAFITVIYFVISYLMAYISRRIEASGSGAARRI
ncbi:amino acid ABC transporter permease [Anaerolineae bacterium CFX9]|nr:amino acid ABC transporter permease [Anaerolineae bacterium CFX9]